MGWRDAPIVRGAPEALQQPVKPTELPGFRGAVAGAETAATEKVRAGLRPGTEAATASATAPVPTQQIYQDLTAARSQVGTIGRQIDRVEQIYNRSLKGVEPWRVAREYFPSIAPTSSVSKDVGRFNTAASQLYSLASQVTRVPGEGSQDRMEFLQKLEAFKPSADDKDSTIEEKIRGMRSLIDERRAFLDARISEVRPPKSPAMRAAQAAIRPSTTKTIRYDARGNRIQ
jgi:hypothetical protein